MQAVNYTHFDIRPRKTHNVDAGRHHNEILLLQDDNHTFRYEDHTPQT